MARLDQTRQKKLHWRSTRMGLYKSELNLWWLSWVVNIITAHVCEGCPSSHNSVGIYFWPAALPFWGLEPIMGWVPISGSAHHQQAACSNTRSICSTISSLLHLILITASFAHPATHLGRQSGGEGMEEWWVGLKAAPEWMLGVKPAIWNHHQLLWASGSFNVEKVKATKCISSCLIEGAKECSNIPH